MEIEQRTGSQTLLYVGDNSDRASALREQLSGFDITVSIVGASAETDLADAVKRPGVCGLVVDYDRPGNDGIEVVQRCLDEDPTLMTVLLAADASADLVDRAYGAGVDEFVHDTGRTASRVVGHEVEDRLDPEGSGDGRSERHMEALADATSDAIISIDASSIIRYANPAVEDVFGYEPDEVLGKPLTMLMGDDLAPRHREGIRRYLRTDERSLDWDDIELVGQHADGHDVPISISFTEFTLDSTRYFTGVIRDVSERRRLEAERKLYHDTTQEILQAETFEDGLDVALDAIGNTMDWAYAEAWTDGEDGHLKRAPSPYVAADGPAEFYERTSPVSFEIGEGLVGRVWESGDYEWVTDIVADDASFQRDGAAAQAGLHAVLAVPIESDGTVVAVMLFFKSEPSEPDDVAVTATRAIAADLGRLMERLEAESALRTERSRKNRMLETSPTGIAIVEGDGTFTYLNDRAGELLGLDAVEGPLTYEDIDVTALTAEDGTEETRLPYRRIIEEGETLSCEMQVTVDGERRWLSIDGAPLYGESGGVTAAVCAIQDVTERKQHERRLQQYETVMQTVSDGVYALDSEGRFVLVNDAYTDIIGYDREELIGTPASEFVGDRITDQARRLQDRIRTGDTGTATMETTLQTADGGTVPVEANISLFDLGDGDYGRVGVVRDITERRRREARLARLNELGQSLTAAETKEGVADIVVEGAREALDLPLTTLAYYDESQGRLQTGRRTEELSDIIGDRPLFGTEYDPLWEAFADGEPRVITDIEEETAVDPERTPLRSALVFPVGGHGVFVAGATTPAAFSDTDVQAARILVANALAALERVDREQELREKTAELEAYTESLERLNRLNSVIRTLTGELTQASTREEIETAVCEELAAADPYVFAWVGEQRTVDGEVRPRAASGRGDGYLDAITADGEEATGPADEAFRTRGPVVRNNLQSDPPFEQWRTQALKRDYRSSIAVPLSYQDTLYGVLTLYADEPGVFDEMEAAVLAELGEMVGYAINAIQRKKALVSDATVALTFALDDQSVPAIQFAAEYGAEFEFEAFVDQGDATLRAFFTVSGADPDSVFDYCAGIPGIHDVSLLSGEGDGHRYEVVVSETGFLGTLISYGAHPTEMTADATGGEVTVELPRSGDVGSFTRMFTREYEGAELTGRTEYDRPVQTRAEFRASYKECLTDRQREVLQTAYFSGFFEWPRETSGQELASKLGVTQPTVSRHVRNGERKLFDIVFEGG
jgi:PAS domain S-box-containing protein